MFEDCKRRGREKKTKTHTHTHTRATARRMGWQEGKREEKKEERWGKKERFYRGICWQLSKRISNWTSAAQPDAEMADPLCVSTSADWWWRDELLITSRSSLSISFPLQTRCKASEYCNLEAEAKPRPQPYLNKLYSIDRPPLPSPPSHPHHLFQALLCLLEGADLSMVQCIPVRCWSFLF